jgi:hypothetical protein
MRAMSNNKENFAERSKLIVGLISAGCSELDAERLERLLSFRSTPDEQKRWIELGVLDAKTNKIIIDADVNEENFTIEVILWNLAYNGDLIKTRGGYQSPDDEVRP